LAAWAIAADPSWPRDAVAVVVPAVKAVTYRISSLGVLGSTTSLRTSGVATVGMLAGARGQETVLVVALASVRGLTVPVTSPTLLTRSTAKTAYGKVWAAYPKAGSGLTVMLVAVGVLAKVARATRGSVAATPVWAS
jgi:hypothetical protein